MRFICFLFLLGTNLVVFSQTLAPERRVDWSLAGLTSGSAEGFVEIDMQARGVVGDGLTPNDLMLDDVLTSLSGTGHVLKFPAGNFLFNTTINLPSNVVIHGSGVEETIFSMDLGGSGDSFKIQGQVNPGNNTTLIEAGVKDNNFLIVSNAISFLVGDWVRIKQEDNDLVSSNWAIGSVGQILQLIAIDNNKLIFNSPLRMDYDLDRSPYIEQIIPIENVGIECLKIHRLDNTAPEQSSNINLSFAVNCWAIGIESENCTFSHIQANASSNLYFAKSYFHHGFEYGGGGRAYGIVFQATSNECLAENNIFEHLRHAMLLQSGANGNVFAYNYSFDPYWDIEPNNATGDMVLHGNFPYANLFEQNICQNMVIDNSHGPNGPYNTFFRNRGEGFGIYFSEANSPGQNLIGNEIPNTNDPYAQYNYNIKGADHFIYGNNNKGMIHPIGTSLLEEVSLTYSTRPDFISQDQWGGIGTPHVMGTNNIPAYDRYIEDQIFELSCGNISTIEKENNLTDNSLVIAPNPNRGVFKLVFKQATSSNAVLSITDLMGTQILYRKKIVAGQRSIVVDVSLIGGTYILLIQNGNYTETLKLVILE